MPRRLGVSRLPTGESRILDGVPSPGGLTAGSCALARALVAMLAHLGRPIGYDALMGLSGIAFVTPLEDDFGRRASAPARCARIPEALSAVGLRGGIRVRTPAAAGDAGGPAGTGESTQLVRSALEGGFAVPVLGWPRAQDDWGIITGYDCGRGVWCGWPHGYHGDAYLGATPGGEAFVIVQEMGVPAEGAQAAVTALRRAVEGRAQVAEAYERRRGMLEEEWGDDPDAPEHVARAMRHELATEALADARTAAAGFLRSCAGLLGPAGGEWALAAAELCDDLVARIEARRPPVLDGRAARALASERLRDRWREELGVIARLDLEALDCVARALTSDLGPGEMGEGDVW